MSAAVGALGAGTRGCSKDGGMVTTEDGQPCQLSQRMCHRFSRIKPFLHTEMHNQGFTGAFVFFSSPSSDTG